MQWEKKITFTEIKDNTTYAHVASVLRSTFPKTHLENSSNQNAGGKPRSSYNGGSKGLKLGKGKRSVQKHHAFAIHDHYDDGYGDIPDPSTDWGYKDRMYPDYQDYHEDTSSPQSYAYASSEYGVAPIVHFDENGYRQKHDDFDDCSDGWDVDP